jgi:hypothetical protein
MISMLNSVFLVGQCSACERTSYTTHDSMHVFVKFDRPAHFPLQSTLPILPVLVGVICAFLSILLISCVNLPVQNSGRSGQVDNAA